MNRNHGNGEFWERVNAALDERRDPYADPHVAGALAERPELLEPLAELLAGVEALGRTPEVVRNTVKPRRFVRFTAAAAVLATAGTLAVLVLRRESTPQFTFEPSRGTVLSLQAEFVRLDAAGRHSTGVDMLDGRRGTSHVLTVPSAEAQFPSVAVLATQSIRFGVH